MTWCSYSVWPIFLFTGLLCDFNMLKALVVLSVLFAVGSAQIGYMGYMPFPMPPPGLMPPREYFIGGQLGYHGRHLPQFRWAGAGTAPPAVRRVQGRILGEFITGPTF